MEQLAPTKRDRKLFRRYARGGSYHIKVCNIRRFHELGWLTYGPAMRLDCGYQSGQEIITDSGREILK